MKLINFSINYNKVNLKNKKVKIALTELSLFNINFSIYNLLKNI